MFRLLDLSDFHSGHLLGLTPPSRWSDENRGWAEPFWNFYVSALEQIGPVDAVVLKGDLIDGPGRKDSTLHLTTDIRQQTEIAMEAIRPIKARKKYVVRGTGYHVDHSGPMEDYIADALGVVAHDELRLAAHKRRMHFRHVVGRSDTPYGQYTQLAKELANDIMQASFEKYESADILGRGHVHYCAVIGVADAETGMMRYVYSNPGMQLRGPLSGGFVRGLRTWLYHVGFFLTEIDKNGEAFLRPILFPIQKYMKKGGYEWLTKEQG